MSASPNLRRLLLCWILAIPVALTLVGCEDTLVQEPQSQITPDQFFNSEQEFLSAATAVYAQRRAVVQNQGMRDMVEHATDAIMVPTRGPDWGDGGVWRQMTQHQWTAAHPFPDNSWGGLQTGIARANGVLTALSGSDFDPQVKQQFSAEVRFLRAYFYYWLMDLFGGVPIVVEEGSDLDFPQQPVDPNSPPPHNNRKEVYDFILQELTGCTSDNFQNACMSGGELNLAGGVISTLPIKTQTPYGRATQEAGYAFLARLLINSPVFAVEIGGASGGSPSDIGSGPGLYEAASAAASRVINSGMYSLDEDYFTNFAADNHTASKEIIFPMTAKATGAGGGGSGGGFFDQQAFLHPNHPFPQTPWNGFTTIAEFYKSFETDVGPDGELGTQDDIHVDERGHMFLAGQQYAEPSSGCSGDECFSDPTSSMLKVRPGGPDAAPLNLTIDIPAIRLGQVSVGPGEDATQIIEASGARPFKFEIDPSATDLNMGNDYPLIRLAEMYLIKAEAENVLNGPSAALPYLNRLRERAGASTVSSVSSELRMHQLIVQEIGFELVFEGGMRRQSLIRYEFVYGGEPVGFPGSAEPSASVYAPTFTGPWRFKETSEAFRVLFPVPTSRLSVNPNLQQNPGY
jgi:hypothetical protein